jgi:hypothetical protein
LGQMQGVQQQSAFSPVPLAQQQPTNAVYMRS